MFNNCINFVILSNWSVKNLKPLRRKTQKHHARVLVFLPCHNIHMKTAHTLIFTLDSKLQGKDWNIFSSRFRLVHACLAPATGCQSAAHFKVCFRIPHSKSRASGEKTAAWFKLPPGISFFCRQAGRQRCAHKALMDLHTVAAATMRANPLRSPATLPRVCPRDLILGNRSSARPRLFHYENIDHRRAGWCQYSYN